MSFCFGVRFDQMRCNFTTGGRGLSPTLTLKIELMGGDAGTTVLASGDLNPPDPNGFVANQVSSANIRLDRSVDHRFVRRARFTIRGDGPGVPITTAWDLKGVEFRTSDGTVLWNYPTLNNISLHGGRVSWTTPGWTSYDPAGYDQPARALSVVIKTGNDDLRKDSAAGVIVVLRGGQTIRTDFGRGVGIRGNTSTRLAIDFSAGAKVNDVVKIFLFKSQMSNLTRFRYTDYNVAVRPTNADSWQVDKLDIVGMIEGGVEVTKTFPSLTGRLTDEFKVWQSPGSIIKPTFTNGIRNRPGHLFLLLDEESYNLTDAPEIHAEVRHRGSTVWTPLTVRTTENESNFSNREPALWLGDAHYFSGRGYGGSSRNCMMRAEAPIWRNWPDRPVEEIRLSLWSGPGPGGVLTESYRGDRKVAIKGIWFGTSGGVAQTGYWPLQAMITLATDFSSTKVLSKNQRSVTYRINHGVPD